MESKKTLGSFLLILTAIIWGTAFAAQRAGMESVEPITFNAARMALAAAAVGFAAFVRLREKDPERASVVRRSAVWGGICCGLFLAAASTFQQMGLVTTTAGKAGFITALYILIVPILSAVLFGKKNGWSGWAAVLIGIAGLYLLCIKDGFCLTGGDALVCISAFLFSGHILCCDHFARKTDPLVLSSIQFVTVAVVSGIAAFMLEKPEWGKVCAAAVPILYCGLISAGVGYTLQMTAQRFTDPTVASLLMSLEAVFAAAAGALLLGEQMSAREIAGCTLMFAAILLVQLPQPESKSRG